MKGQKVIVRAYGNVPLLRRVWDANEKTVYVMAEDEYQKLLAGLESYDPVGFSVKDTFEYTEGLVLSDSIDWSKLVKWKH